MRNVEIPVLYLTDKTIGIKHVPGSWEVEAFFLWLPDRLPLRALTESSFSWRQLWTVEKPPVDTAVKQRFPLTSEASFSWGYGDGESGTSVLLASLLSSATLQLFVLSILEFINK